MAGEAAKGTMGIFIVFVLSRALHPMVIDYSKVDGKMLYSKNSPAIMSQILSMVFVNFLAWKDEGMKGVKACWEIPKGHRSMVRIRRFPGNAVHGCYEWWCLPAPPPVETLDHRSDDDVLEGHYAEWLEKNIGDREMKS